MIKLLENHQFKKCVKCPFSEYSYDDGTSYCRFDGKETKLARIVLNLTSDNYSGCFVPMPIIKLIAYHENKDLEVVKYEV